MTKLPVRTKDKHNRNDKLSGDELSSLDEFCSDFEVDEVEFEKWNHSHRDLNIIIPLFVSSGDTPKGGLRELQFSREIINSAGESRRERTSVTITIPEIVKNGEQLILNGLGSAQESNRGDLIVIINIK